jgi:hypothetical protein
MVLGSDWQQTLPTTLAAPSKNRFPALGFHSGAKSVLTLSSPLGRLIGSFHGNISWILRVGKNSRRTSDVN